jgi:hypothetical protein
VLVDSACTDDGRIDQVWSSRDGDDENTVDVLDTIKIAKKSGK